MVRLALVTSVTCRPGQLPDQPAVHRAEQHLAPLGPLAQPVDVVEQPAQLRAGEVGGQRQSGARPGTAPRRTRRPARAAAAPVRVSCQTMAWCTGRPVARSQTTVVSRWLVMPTAASRSGRSPAAAQRLARPPAGRWPRSPRRRARPSPAGGRSAGARAGPRRRSRPAGRRRCTATRWCPDRWRRRTGAVTAAPYPAAWPASCAPRSTPSNAGHPAVVPGTRTVPTPSPPGAGPRRALTRTVVPPGPLSTTISSLSCRASHSPHPPGAPGSGRYRRVEPFGGDPGAVVGDGAVQELVGTPQPQPAVPAAVPDGIRDQLVDREDVVVEPGAGESGRRRAVGDGVP